MEATGSESGGAQDAPRSGATAPAPFLDKGDGNVPRDNRPGWNKKQWTTRRTVLDRLRLWQAEGYQCLWVTLTSSPQSPVERLRADFQALRKRVGRELGFWTMEYVCVDTREGHDVLHMIWAWKDREQSERGSFYIPLPGYRMRGRRSTAHSTSTSSGSVLRTGMPGASRATSSRNTAAIRTPWCASRNREPVSL